MTKNITHPKTDTPAKSENNPALPPTEAEIEAKNNYLAKLLMSPELSAALVIKAFHRDGNPDMFALLEQLQAQHASLAADSMAQAESMLLSQATSMQTIFTRLAVQAADAHSLDQIQCLLGLAIRAQNGSRATLQTLFEMKNPRPITFVSQANIAQGPQQVNNGLAPQPSVSTHAQEKPAISTIKLSGANHELLKDTRAPGQAIAGHPVMATVEKVHRS